MSANLKPIPIERPGLSHWSKVPLGELRSIEQDKEREYVSCYDKPKGFWVSVDGEDDWKAWCDSETFNLDGLACRYAITLGNPDRLLWISDPDEMPLFTERYGNPDRHCSYSSGIDRYAIDWRKVAEEHAGLIIAPYHWQHRLELSWYYGWDCASGCIWDVSVIASVTQSDAEVKQP